MAIIVGVPTAMFRMLESYIVIMYNTYIDICTVTLIKKNKLFTWRQIKLDRQKNRNKKNTRKVY